MKIRDPGWEKFGSGFGDGKNSDPVSGINIPDPQHCKKGAQAYNFLIFLSSSSK
jgi:hypothetical protein